MNRMIELEQQINAAAAAAATAAHAADPTGLPRNYAHRGPSVSRRVSFDVGSRGEKEEGGGEGKVEWDNEVTLFRGVSSSCDNDARRGIESD